MAEFYVPIKSNEKVNSIRVEVDYEKENHPRHGGRGVYASMMGVKRDTSDPTFRSFSFICFDPVHKSQRDMLETLKKLNRRRLEMHINDVDRELQERSGVHWARVKDFANKMGFEIEENHGQQD